MGVIDGVHFKIMRPLTKDPIPEKYFNRKNCYSLNCVMICDEERRIQWFTCRHAGSAHDSRIWEESHLKAELARTLPTHLQLPHWRRGVCMLLYIIDNCEER